jgi:hypothetical protein
MKDRVDELREELTEPARVLPTSWPALILEGKNPCTKEGRRA